jgi:hypothetical protein
MKTLISPGFFFAEGTASAKRVQSFIFGVGRQAAP